MSEATQNYVRLELNQGKSTLINIEDVDAINEQRWFFDSSNGYARAKIWKDGKKKTVSLHQFLTNPEKGMEVDHINGDRLDNTRSNLRVVFQYQNCWNIDFYSHSKGRHKGLFPRKIIGGITWDVKISVNDKSLHIGTFRSEADAINAYVQKGRELRGDFFTLDRGEKKDFSIYPLIPKPKRINPSSSGFTNVYPKSGKWMYYAVIGDVKLYKSGFLTPELASAAVEVKIKEIRDKAAKQAVRKTITAQ